MVTDERQSNAKGRTGLPSSSHAPSRNVPALRDPPPASKPKRRFWLWGVGGLIVVALAGLVSANVWKVGPPVAAVEVATLAPVTRVLAVNGRIAAVNTVEIRPLVSGPLIAPLVAEGDHVGADQILAQIDPAAQNTVVRQAIAGLDAALVAQQQAAETYDRAVALGRNVARTMLEADAHALQSAKQEVARQSALLDQARVGLENHTVRAPFAGTILTLNAKLGQLAGPTTPLLTLADLSDLVVEADVDEAYATQVARNQPAVVQLAGEAGNREGHVSYVSTRVDVATGGLAIKIAFDDPITAPIGLTVTTNIIVDQRDASLTVPRLALASKEGETGVFLLKEGTARFQPVSVVAWPAVRLIVTEGLVENDILITDASNITDGMAVTADQP